MYRRVISFVKFRVDVKKSSTGEAGSNVGKIFTKFDCYVISVCNYFSVYQEMIRKVSFNFRLL